MANTMIEVQDLTKHFGAVQALRGVSFAVPHGQVVGLLGPNGAGKTTAMRIITGYLAPTAGAALIDGQDVVEAPISCRRRVGYLPEGNPLYTDLRVVEALDFTARMHEIPGSKRRSAVKESIRTAGLLGRERSLIGTLSKGYRQRVGLAQALLHEPDVLILDEPTSGLDPNQQEDMRGLIRRLGEEHTVILSTHILPEVEATCGRVMIIDKGRLAADGTVAEIRRQAGSQSAVLIVVRGSSDDAVAAVSALDDVTSAKASPVEGEGAVHRLWVGVAGQADRGLLEQIARTLFERGLHISELVAETASLERVFADLTVGADANTTETETL
jgi:ABC-2 type transport system ATP-binding protein